MSRKQRIFIGSSAEAHAIAEALQSQLQYDFDVTIWSQDVFTAAVATFESIDEAVRAHAYGVFVFAPDDPMKMRGTEGYAPRLNVVLEMGYFAGVHGMRRTFVLEPRGGIVHTLSDLAGITTAQFDLDRFKSDGAAALGPAVYAIKQAISRDRIAYPREHLGRQNLLSPEVRTLIGAKGIDEPDRYCLAAKLGQSQSIKLTIRGSFRQDDEPEKAFAWGFPISPVNTHWERLPPLGIHDGTQSLYALGPGLAHTTVKFRDVLVAVEFDVFENDSASPTFTKNFVIS
ncbi:nucleotide-binding protein [Xanthomonas sp. AM6]|uniref:nucleotide-binding protein n=1 Tax=Xanthomonas sp. AM6 TaxID=2982531 RepID=UPI0021D88288|nr:nucleotide-binding protein [Xanthomonas sp. AM6]UYB51133.1 nucleotide-binding protein [Xanthomonas sp. AM6]